MSLGQLSPAAAEYGATLSQLTGLDPAVVVTWLGAEEPWGSTDPTNNYLNIGPGNTYATPQQGAAAAAALINNSSQYTSIKQAAAAGDPTAQISAIEASPWDGSSHYGGALGSLYSDVVSAVGAGPTLTASHSLGQEFKAFWHGLTNPGAGLKAGASVAGSAVASGAKKAGGAIAKEAAGAFSSAALQKALLTIAFVAAGLGLIVLGLTRIFPGVTRTVTSTIGTIAGGAAKAAAA